MGRYGGGSRRPQNTRSVAVEGPAPRRTLLHKDPSSYAVNRQADNGQRWSPPHSGQRARGRDVSPDAQGARAARWETRGRVGLRAREVLAGEAGVKRQEVQLYVRRKEVSANV